MESAEKSLRIKRAESADTKLQSRQTPWRQKLRRHTFLRDRRKEELSAKTREAWRATKKKAFQHGRGRSRCDCRLSEDVDVCKGVVFIVPVAYTPPSRRRKASAPQAAPPPPGIDASPDDRGRQADRNAVPVREKKGRVGGRRGGSGGGSYFRSVGVVRLLLLSHILLPSPSTYQYYRHSKPLTPTRDY